MSAARKQGNEILPEKLRKVNPFQVRRRALVKFDVAGHSGFRLRRHREKTFPVQLRLHPDPVKRAQDRSEKRAKPPVSPDGTIRKTRVHEKHFCAAFLRQKHHIRPDFRFKDHQCGRTDHPQDPADKKSHIHRAEKHLDSGRNLVPCDFLRSRGRRAEHKLPVRILRDPFFQERKRHIGLPDADRMNPDSPPHTGKRLFPLRRKNSEAFHIILFASRAPDQFHDQPRQEK